MTMTDYTDPAGDGRDILRAPQFTMRPEYLEAAERHLTEPEAAGWLLALTRWAVRGECPPLLLQDEEMRRAMDSVEADREANRAAHDDLIGLLSGGCSFHELAEMAHRASFL